MNDNNSVSEFLRFKKVWLLTPTFQVFLIIASFITIAIIGKLNIMETGLLFGRPNSFYLETLFAPIYEEILFRGVIFILFLNRYSMVKALALTSFLFGIWHLKNIYFTDVEHVLKQMAYIGLVFAPIMCYITYKTKTVWIATIIHYLNNIFSFLLIHFDIMSQ